MSFDISKYREMFLEEAAELFESADNVLLAAENNGSLTDDEMGQLFRDVHTLKGSGASVELAFFAEFTHDVENLMDKLRSHKIEYQPEMAETLIDGLDVMKEILELEVSNQINREKHLHRGGAGAIYWYGKLYKSINSAVKEVGYSFKYIKRRIISDEYKECYFV